MSISGNQVKIKQDAVIDPNFFLPPGVIDMRYRTDGDISDGENQDYTSDEEVEADITIVDSDGNIDEPYALIPPDNVTVVSQIVHLASDGRAVVDVVLEVDDVPGVTSYDVRVARA